MTTTMKPSAASPAAGLHVLNDLPAACDVGEALDLMRANQLSQLWICPPLHLDRSAAALDRAAAAGWNIHISPPRDGQTVDPEQPAAHDDWLLAFRPGEYTAAGYSLVWPALDPRHIWQAAESDPQTLLAALRRYADAVGIPYYRTPQTTGGRLLRALHSGPHATALETATSGKAEMPPPARNDSRDELQDPPIMWRRAVTPEEIEQDGPYLLTFDMNAQFLRATNGLALGFGAVQHLTGAMAQGYCASAWQHGPTPGPRLIAPGYYRVWATAGASSALARLPIPHPLYRFASPERAHLAPGAWVAAPTVRLLVGLRVAFACSEAYVWPTSHRILDPWFKRLSVARTALMADPTPAGTLALDVVKQTYARFVGALATDSRSDADALKRPDWRHQVTTEARALHYRAMLRAVDRGYFPVYMTEDTLGFLSPEPDHAEAAARLDLRYSATAGQYKRKDGVDLRAAGLAQDVRAMLLDDAPTAQDMQKLLAKVRREQEAAS